MTLQWITKTTTIILTNNNNNSDNAHVYSYTPMISKTLQPIQAITEKKLLFLQLKIFVQFILKATIPSQIW